MISIVVVSWNSGADLGPCVASLAQARARSAVPVELIVVDNGSEDPPGDTVRRLWPDADVVERGENLGFGPGVNAGAARARGDVLLLVNPDARAREDVFGAIAAAFDGNPDWVAVAPRLVDARETPPPGPLLRSPEASARTGSRRREGEESQEEFQLRRLPTLRQAARELLLVDRAFPRNRGRARDRYLDRDRTTAFAVEQPAAAVLAVRSAAFARIGGFDPRFVPAWWEDVDLCARLGALGKIMYCPEAVFEHAGGASAQALGYARFLPVYYRNAIAYWRKHHGGAAALLFRMLVAAGMALRLGCLPFRRRDPRPKRESSRAYVGALRAALSPERRPRATP